MAMSCARAARRCGVSAMWGTRPVALSSCLRPPSRAVSVLATTADHQQPWRTTSSVLLPSTGRREEEDEQAHPQRSRAFSDVAYDNSGAACPPAPILGRFAVLAEVLVSKIFPAGFGWQGASAVAEAAGLEDDQVGFFLMTGAGDFVGVLTGHCLFYAIKKGVFDDSISMSDTFQLGVWLATAAFCSGAMWQPFVNAFQAEGNAFGFNTSVGLTTLACGAMFFVGLRLGRAIYDPIMPALPGPDYDNLRYDAQLSIAVGGATGCFVGTDTSYGDANWMGPLLGVTDDDAILTGMVKAGSSTAIGFTAVQLVQNVAVPHGKCWLD